MELAHPIHTHQNMSCYKEYTRQDILCIFCMLPTIAKVDEQETNAMSESIQQPLYNMEEWPYCTHYW